MQLSILFLFRNIQFFSDFNVILLKFFGENQSEEQLTRTVCYYYNYYSDYLKIITITVLITVSVEADHLYTCIVYHNNLIIQSRHNCIYQNNTILYIKLSEWIPQYGVHKALTFIFIIMSIVLLFYKEEKSSCIQNSEMSKNTSWHYIQSLLL